MTIVNKPNGRNERGPKWGFQNHRDVVGGVNLHPLALGLAVPFPMHIMYLRSSPLRGRVVGMNNRQSRGSGSLDRGQSCLAEA
ncbi:hypothetical protein A7K73_10560 [Candidatus Methylacidiphilum fumarolicum]|nr:hypothetical protein A7K73_10560 [Candidatus Methylacidiphilum fumarolicum]TFE77709.1 hypothetical protein A7D33_03560 [Candidatus Methylacidiphilum fumarolicum]